MREKRMRRAKPKPSTKKERAEKRKKRKEKRAAKRAIPSGHSTPAHNL
jgi:hypothetical protein